MGKTAHDFTELNKAFGHLLKSTGVANMENFLDIEVRHVRLTFYPKNFQPFSNHHIIDPTDVFLEQVRLMYIILGDDLDCHTNNII